MAVFASDNTNIFDVVEKNSPDVPLDVAITSRVGYQSTMAASGVVIVIEPEEITTRDTVLMDVIFKISAPSAATITSIKAIYTNSAPQLLDSVWFIFELLECTILRHTPQEKVTIDR